MPSGLASRTSTDGWAPALKEQAQYPCLVGSKLLEDALERRVGRPV